MNWISNAKGFLGSSELSFACTSRLEDRIICLTFTRIITTMWESRISGRSCVWPVPFRGAKNVLFLLSQNFIKKNCCRTGGRYNRATET
jgi:hypothetical protein